MHTLPIEYDDIIEDKYVEFVDLLVQLELVDEKDLIFSYEYAFNILQVEVDYEYTPGTPGSRYTADGDPGDPPEGPEVEIRNVYLIAPHLHNTSTRPRNISVIDYLTDKTLDSFEEIIAEHNS